MSNIKLKEKNSKRQGQRQITFNEVIALRSNNNIDQYIMIGVIKISNDHIRIYFLGRMTMLR